MERLKKVLITFFTFVLLFQFMLPIRSEAFDLTSNILGDISAEDIITGATQAVAGIADLVMSAGNNMMLGTKGLGSAMVTHEALGKGSWFDGDFTVDLGGDGEEETEPTGLTQQEGYEYDALKKKETTGTLTETEKKKLENYKIKTGNTEGLTKN